MPKPFGKLLKLLAEICKFKCISSGLLYVISQNVTYGFTFSKKKIL
jgi:hypothetical protein